MFCAWMQVIANVTMPTAPPYRCLSCSIWVCTYYIYVCCFLWYLEELNHAFCDLQKYVILKSEKVLQDTIEDYGTNGFPECFKLADLGCSNGPNTFLFIANTLDSVHKECQKKNLKLPDEFQVFLNDLPNNDFNALFKMVPPFYLKHENERDLHRSSKCFICGVPGSFYTRLFPSKSLHFVHSSYSVHWLSQVIILIYSMQSASKYFDLL